MVLGYVYILATDGDITEVTQMARSAEEAWTVVERQDNVNKACASGLHGSARDRYITQVQCMKNGSVKVKG